MPPCLRLILPGLLWPDKVFHDICADLDLPALSWLLGRARITPWPATQPIPAPEEIIYTALGLLQNPRQSPPPYAALRLLGEDGAPEQAVWLCADPLHLNVEQRRLTLGQDTPPADAEELAEIVDALNPLFAETGTLVAGCNGHAYLRLATLTLPDLQTTPPAQASNLNAMLPQGNDALHWRQRINEAQMLLHTLPCNARREQRGIPRLNTLWLWGAGTLPAAMPPPAQQLRLFGDAENAILKGMAQRAGTTLEPLPPLHTLLPTLNSDTRSLCLLAPLQAPARAYDALRWREILLQLEHDWFAPLRLALSRGQLRHLQITALGDDAASACDITLSSRDCLRFWRRPRALHSLSASPSKAAS